MSMWRWIGVGVFLVSVPACATDLITEPESALYVAPTVYNGSFSGRMGDPSVANPSWHFVQWNNPQSYAAGLNYTGSVGSDWSFSTSTARVQFYAGGPQDQGVHQHTYELAQSGSTSQYLLACGQEFDLFLEANTGDYKDLSGTIAAYRFSQSRPLNKLTEVDFRFSLEIPYESTVSTCNLNYVGYLVSAYLTSNKGFGMFYQVFLRDSRGSSASVRNSPCLGYPANKLYCFSSTIDQVVSGQPMQSVSSVWTSYNINVFRLLSQAIAQTGDPALADWQITGVYYGELMQGGMSPVSRWTAFKLSAF